MSVFLIRRLVQAAVSLLGVTALIFSCNGLLAIRSC